ncbi:MAG: hypothetical protein AAFR87_28995 [Bacteroidota bacterium]
MKNPFVIFSLFLFLLCLGDPSPVQAQKFMPDQYLFGPSAIPMEKGELRYRNNGITLNSLHLGISNHVSIDVGAELLLSSILILLNEGGLISFANVKYGYSFHENFHLGGGVFAGGMLSSDPYNRAAFVASYGLVTLGNTINNFSLAFGKASGGQYNEDPFFFMFSGKVQLGRRWDLISENYLVFQKLESRLAQVNGSVVEMGGGLDSYFACSMAVRFYSRIVNLDLGLSGLHTSYSNSFIDRSNGQANVVKRRNNVWFPIPIPIVALSFSIR